jgi:ureidoacrylate peracid hydrolase
MEALMHRLSIPQSVVDRVVARRGREHVDDALDPAKTALVVVDMQNAFMLPGVAHALCPMAEKTRPCRAHDRWHRDLDQNHVQR